MGAAESRDVSGGEREEVISSQDGPKEMDFSLSEFHISEQAVTSTPELSRRWYCQIQ